MIKKGKNQKIKVLIVDDFISTCQIYKTAIEDFFRGDAEVDTCHELDKIESLSGGAYDVLFLDWILDDRKDPEKTASYVIESINHKKAALTTSYYEDEKVISFAEKNNIPIIKKPSPNGFNDYFDIVKLFLDNK